MPTPKFREAVIAHMKREVLPPGTCEELSRTKLPQLSRYKWIKHRVGGIELYHASEVDAKKGPWDDVYAAYTIKELSSAILTHFKTN